MKTVNLTQHNFTVDQLATVTEMQCDRELVKTLITFDDAPDMTGMTNRANKLADIAKDSGAEYAMIGGAPFFMSTLEKSLKRAGIKPMYSFSKRAVVEVQNDDGTVEKKSVFKHEKWVVV